MEATPRRQNGTQPRNFGRVMRVLVLDLAYFWFPPKDYTDYRLTRDDQRFKHKLGPIKLAAVGLDNRISRSV
jgi:hypothetical protein